MDQLNKLAQACREGRISRREFFSLAAKAGVSVAFASSFLAACAPAPTPTPTPTPTPVPVAPTPTPVPVEPTPTTVPFWERYAGTEITALFTSNTLGEALEERYPVFEDLTGMKVDFRILEPASMWDKQAVDFAAGSSELDVWHTHLPNNGVKYNRAGWYEFLEPYVENSELTHPDYDVEDFGPALPGTIDGKLVGIPLFLETNTLFHNLELMEQAGVDRVPETMDELEEAAKKVNDLGEEIYGWSTRGFSPYNTSTFAQVFFSFGGEWFDEEGNANLNSPEAIAAIDWYGRMLRLYGPPAADTLDWTRAAELFGAGQVGFYTDAPGQSARFVDPEQSRIVGKFRMAIWPAGPAGSVPNIGGWSACIGKFSEKKEAAWHYIQWITSKEEALTVARMAGLPPARLSLLQDPEYREAQEKATPGLLEAMAYAIEHGRADVYPPTEVAMEGRTALADAIVSVIQGADPKAAAEEANTKFQAVLDKEAA